MKIKNQKSTPTQTPTVPSGQVGRGSDRNVGEIKNSQSGFAALLVTVLILAAVFSIGTGIFVLSHGEQKIIKDIVKSGQAYYSAEAGIEDALLRLVKGLNWSSPYKLSVGGNWATTTVSNIIGGSRNITAEGNALDRTRKLQISYGISSESVSFYYGAQVGDGGVEMENLSIIEGNVFSNGSIIAEDSGAKITGTVKVAGVGNKIKKATILADAYADICDDADITGALYTNNNQSCAASSTSALGSPPAPLALPISQAQIDDWKQESLTGGVSGSQIFSSGVNYLGPKKIEGNLTVKNDAQLLITGALWVTGAIDIKNSAIVKLDPASYGSLSGKIVSDGVIILQNNSVSSGSGQAGSYLAYISTSPLKPAIVAKNNAKADIIFTSNGWVDIQNNTILREVTGYGIELENNAKISYEVGLQDASFSSGPGGSWKVTGWQEIE